MKTTFEIPDDLYREVKARSALAGRSVKAFVLEALRMRLAADEPSTDGWRSVFGAAKPGDTKEVQRIVDESFSQVDPGDWE